MDNCNCNEIIEPRICKIVDRAEMPFRATPDSACFDVRLCLHQDTIKINGKPNGKVNGEDDKRHITLFSGDRALMPTGLIVTPPKGYKLTVKPRSGLAFKQGITVINTPGTVDSDYSHELYVLLINHNDIGVQIYDGERIAQIEFEPITTDSVKWKEVTMKEVLEFRDNQTRQGGIGHTGK